MHKRPQGYIALTAILVVLAATLAVAMSANLLSIDSGRSALTVQSGQEAFVSAEACLEEAILRLQRDDTFSGGSLNIGTASCTMTILTQGSERTITAQGSSASIQRSLTAHVTLTPTFTFDWWQEN